MISIVDDDESVRVATKELIDSLGYSASTFCSAEEFLESKQIDETICLITDLNMPGLNGIELQNRLIADGHSIPIIFITAYPEERLRQRAMQAGAICFIAKPYNDEHLIGCLDRALKRNEIR